MSKLKWSNCWEIIFQQVNDNEEIVSSRRLKKAVPANFIVAANMKIAIVEGDCINTAMSAAHGMIKADSLLSRKK